MFLHHARVFTTCLVFTACACFAVAPGSAAQPAPTSSDNDGIFVFSIAAFVQPVGWPAIANAMRADEHVGPGVEFQRWRLATAMGPLTLSVTRVDLHNPHVALAVGTRMEQVIGFGEPLSTMAERRGAEAGINADYFDISGNGMPTNLVLANGVVQHAPNGRAALLVGQANQIIMGPVTWQTTITAPSGASVTVNTVNDWSAGTQLMLFTQRFGVPGPAEGATEVILAPTEDGRYTVVKAGPNQPTFLPLRLTDLGLAARGDAATTLLQTFHVGDVVTMREQLDPSLPGLREGVGGGPLLLRDGVPYEDPNAPAPEERDVRYPLTGAGVSADGATMWLVTVDGRAPGRSIGITRPMLGTLLAALGASNGMAFDSGGSTEMVIRRLGDPQVTVANVPSDGRERYIADGLFVINTATPGPPAKLVLRAGARGVLTGSHIAIAAESVDANDQPVPVAQQMRYSIVPGDSATIDVNGILKGVRPGDITVIGEAGTTRGELHIRVVPNIAHLDIARFDRALAPGVAYQLSAVARTGDGAAIAVDPDAIRWSSAGDGSIDTAGVFHAAQQASRALVVARAGGARAEATVLVGAHRVSLQSSMQPGSGAGQWHLASTPEQLAAALDSSKAPDGALAMHLSYDFAGYRGTRAAMAQGDLPVPGEPIVITLEVYGDGNGAWLRGGYRNVDGINDTITIARHVTWTGWRTVRLDIPVQARWPIVLTKIYVVAPPSEKGAGDVWLRNLAAWYAGP